MSSSFSGGAAQAGTPGRQCPPAPRRLAPLPPPPEVPLCIRAALRGDSEGGMAACGNGELHPALAQARALLDGGKVAADLLS